MSQTELASGRGKASQGERTAWAWAIGTFFGAGLLKPGPGTWGSVGALLLWLAADYGLHPTPIALGAATTAAALLAIAFGIPAATIVARESGRDDPQYVVIDEAAGQWIALLPAAFSTHPDWPHALLALALFRLFDITKPAPARQLERLRGGAGILLDDVAAGLYALLVAALVQHWW
jgi:phosphatidylglycerophosphatase A